jgi:hypothetical protein
LTRELQDVKAALIDARLELEEAEEDRGLRAEAGGAGDTRTTPLPRYASYRWRR